MTRSEYEYKWKQCHSSSEHVDVCEDYIKSLEQQLADIKDNNRKLIELIQTANSNLEAQEIMIADYKKRIEELKSTTIPFIVMTENQALRERITELEAPKSCELCVHRIEPNRQFPSFSCSILQRHIRNDFFCADYEPMDKQ